MSDAQTADAEDAAGIQARPPQPVDIEHLLQWAVGRSGRLPWRRDDERDLGGNHGLTARPRRRPKIGWHEAEVYALTVRGPRQLTPRMLIPGPDAEIVLAAVKALEPATAAVVIACARGKIRPDWMPGVEPKRVLRARYVPNLKRKKRHRRTLVPRWEPCSPAELQAARDVYVRWHAALEALADQLQGRLAGWTVCGFLAPATPWQAEREKTS